MRSYIPTYRLLLFVALSLPLAACGTEGDAAQAPSRAPEQPQATAQSDAATFVAHPEHIQPGLTQQRALASLKNPREGDARAIEEGKGLFVGYNCADCHGAGGSGAMGPALDDGRWHFGGSAGEVYQSIYEGRPDGMPSWGGRLPDAQIWALVSYVRSLNGGRDVSTENFEGKTVERTGH